MLKKTLCGEKYLVRIDAKLERVTLDEVVERCCTRGVDVVKSDIEGAGYQVVVDRMKLVKRCESTIFLELHSIKRRKAINILKDLVSFYSGEI